MLFYQCCNFIVCLLLGSLSNNCLFYSSNVDISLSTFCVVSFTWVPLLFYQCHHFIVCLCLALFHITDLFINVAISLSVFYLAFFHITAFTNWSMSHFIFCLLLGNPSHNCLPLLLSMLSFHCLFFTGSLSHNCIC